MSERTGTPEERYLVGGYTAPHGEAAGVVLLERTGAAWASRPVADVPSPSFLARHPELPVLYAVAEHLGELVVLEVADDGAEVVRSVPAGAAACHVRVAPDGRSVVVACWGDGAVVRYRLDERGRVLDAAHGATAGEGSRAHATLPLGDGFVSTDLGLDLLRVWADDGAGIRETQRLELPPGSGPRHLVAHPNGRLYVVTEFSVEILEIAVGVAGELSLVRAAPARPVPRAEGDTGAEIAVDPTGAWLSVGVRGSDRIAVSRILPDGGTEPVAEGPSGGERPRHHVHDSRGVLVANEASSTVARLAFDPATGAVGPVLDSVAVGTPTFLLPV